MPILHSLLSHHSCLSNRLNMSTMSRVSHASRSALLRAQNLARGNRVTSVRSLATASGDDTTKPTALAKLHLEDGTTFVGKSFGSHEAVEGEVSCLTVPTGYGSLLVKVSKNSTSRPVLFHRSFSPPVWLDILRV